jgi:hypothetical protein
MRISGWRRMKACWISTLRGCQVSSESTNATRRPRAAAQPALRAEATPRLNGSRTIRSQSGPQVSCRPSSTCSVVSVLASSTAISSRGRSVCANTESIVSPTVAAEQ